MAEQRGPGQPPHEPTGEQRKTVQLLAAYGIKHDAIAAEIGISDETLRKHYAAELAHGNSRVLAQVANALVRRALGDGPDAVNAAKFFLERRGGDAWKAKFDAKVHGDITVEIVQFGHKASGGGEGDAGESAPAA